MVLCRNSYVDCIPGGFGWLELQRVWAGDPGAFYIESALGRWIELKWTQPRGSESIMHRVCPCEVAEAKVDPSQEVCGGSWGVRELWQKTWN